MSKLSEKSQAAFSESGEALHPGKAIVPCIHCGEPTECKTDVPVDRVFCCAGCRGAYELIHGWGLQDFYALRDGARVIGAARAAGKSTAYDQFDADDFLGPSRPVTRKDGSCWTELAVHGLHCGACAWLIENAMAREPGVISSRVKMGQHSVQVVYDGNRTKLSRIAQLLDSLGYQLAPFDASLQDHIQVENRRLLVQIAIAGFLAANAMWIAIALYAGGEAGVESEYRYFLRAMGTMLGLIAVFGPGRTFFSGALASLKTKTPHMDLPVALGLLVGALVGGWNALRGTGDVYFDSLATLVFLLLIGRWIQFRQQRRAAQTVDLMLRITPQHATLLRDGQPRSVLAATLVSGDILRVSAGESLAADGEIISGKSSLDRSLLTGESLPVDAHVGDHVSAGTVNLTAPLEVRVTAVGNESRIGRVMLAVEQAASEKTPVVLLANRIGGYFVVTVVCLAIATFVWWARVDLASATGNATALLIVACPCALALATPLAVAVALGRAAQSGILIRDGGSLQLLASPGHIWFDKTGTLTEGKQRITTLVGDEAGLKLAAAIEVHCAHPIAQSIVLEAKRRDLEIDAQATLDRVVLGGVMGHADGHAVIAGNAALMQYEHVRVPVKLEAAASSCAAGGQSPILIAVDRNVVTVLGMSDPLRADALQLVGRLRQRGWTAGILSGDHPAIVARVAEQLGFAAESTRGGLSPEQKLDIVRNSRHEKQTIAMVGDGANDAAALSAADVGIAVRGGAEASLRAAPIFVATGRLESISDLLDGSRRTRTVIILAFSLSLAYNAVAIVLALMGWINPLAAAVLMPISSASVLAVTLASKTFKGHLS